MGDSSPLLYLTGAGGWAKDSAQFINQKFGEAYDSFSGNKKNREAQQEQYADQNAKQDALLQQGKAKAAADQNALGQAALLERQRQQASASSRRSTLLTGPLGVPGTTPTPGRTTLLGG